MIAPIADKLLPGLLEENGGALPRNAEGQVSLPGLQHVGARGYDFPDLRGFKAPPSGFAFASESSTAPPLDVLRFNVYDLFASAHPSPAVQPHVDFRALLKRAGDADERRRQAEGTTDWSSSPKRISELAESALRSLHEQGCFALTLFEVALACALWVDEVFDKSPEAPPEEVARMGEEAGENPLRAITDLTKTELGTLTEHLFELLRVATGSTAAGLAEFKVPSFVLDDHFLYAPGSPATLRSFGEVIDHYQKVRVWFNIMVI